jgi:hypothetical protein
VTTARRHPVRFSGEYGVVQLSRTGCRDGTAGLGVAGDLPIDLIFDTEIAFCEAEQERAFTHAASVVNVAWQIGVGLPRPEHNLVTPDEPRDPSL